MGFITKFLAGAVLSGGLTVAYHNEIMSGANQLQTEVDKLSKDVSRALVSSKSVPVSEETKIPTRMPFSEHMKARWNETVIRSVDAVRNFSVQGLTESASAAYKSYTTPSSSSETSTEK